MGRDANFDFVRDPDEWATGDEPVTESQRRYLATLSARTGEPLSEEDFDRMTKSEASELIDELQQFGGR